jgi:hypothetical protein
LTDAAKRQWAKFLIFVAVGCGLAGLVLWVQADKDAEWTLGDQIVGNPPPPPADHMLHVVLLAAGLVAVLCSVILFSSAKAEERDGAEK